MRVGGSFTFVLGVLFVWSFAANAQMSNPHGFSQSVGMCADAMDNFQPAQSQDLSALCNLSAVAVDDAAYRGYRAPDLQEGQRLEGGPRQQVRIDCGTGSILVRGERAGVCQQMHTELYREGLPRIYACARSAGMHFFATRQVRESGIRPSDRWQWESSSIEMRHAGIFNEREIRGSQASLADDGTPANDAATQTSLSLHTFGRAIDIRTMSIGGTTFDYENDNPRDGTRDPGAEQTLRWMHFWVPFKGCLATRGFGVIDNEGGHFHHLHISLGVSEEERVQLGCARI